MGIGFSDKSSGRAPAKKDNHGYKDGCGSRMPISGTQEDLGSLVFFGFGLYWAWVWILGETPVLAAFPSAASGATQSEPSFVGHFFAALTMLFGALFSKQIDTQTGRRLLMLGAGLPAALSTIVYLFAGEYSSGDWISIVGLALVGISRASFNLLWGALFCKLDLRKGAMFMFGSIAIGTLLCVAVTSLQPESEAFVELLLPIFAVITIYYSERHLDKLEIVRLFNNSCTESATFHSSEADEGKNSIAKTRFPFKKFIRLFLGIFIYAFVFAFVSGPFFSLEGERTALVFEFAFLTVGIGATIAAYHFSRKPRLQFAYRFILLIVSIGFLSVFLLEGGNQSIAVGCVFVGFTAFDAVTWLALAQFAQKLVLPSFQVYGFGRAVHFIAMALGSLASVSVIPPEGGFMEALAPISAFFVVALIVASTFILTEQSLFSEPNGTESLQPQEDQEERELDTEHELDVDRRTWKESCATVGARFNLTPREQEVLMLLAKGWDASYIQDQLCISSHTVRSHIYHIYQKMGVHSQQDILRLIEAERKE